jgi:hypothetical protein
MESNRVLYAVPSSTVLYISTVQLISWYAGAAINLCEVFSELSYNKSGYWGVSAV